MWSKTNKNFDQIPLASMGSYWPYCHIRFHWFNKQLMFDSQFRLFKWPINDWMEIEMTLRTMTAPNWNRYHHIQKCKYYNWNRTNRMNEIGFRSKYFFYRLVLSLFLHFFFFFVSLCLRSIEWCHIHTNRFSFIQLFKADRKKKTYNI